MGGWWSSLGRLAWWRRSSTTQSSSADDANGFTGATASSAPRIFDQTLSLQIVVVGLDGAGKTTLLRRLMFDPDRHSQVAMAGSDPTPTVGFNVESGRIGRHDVHMWDLAGQERSRPLWDTYFHDGVDCVIFVVDGTDAERLPLARQELMRVFSFDSVVRPRVASLTATGGLHGASSDAVFLILVNKADDAACVSAAALEKDWAIRLEAERIVQNRMRAALQCSSASQSPVLPPAAVEEGRGFPSSSPASSSAVSAAAAVEVDRRVVAASADPRALPQHCNVLNISARTGSGVQEALSWLIAAAERAAALRHAPVKS